MVGKAASRAFLSLLFLLTLCSCGFFSSSFFPEDFMQASARKDLSDEIPKAAGNSFMLSTVNVGGTDYVVLASNLAYDGIHVFFMDEDLRVVSAFTLEELNAPPISTKSFEGNGAFADCNSTTQVVVGNRWFLPSASGFILQTQPNATMTSTSSWSSGFAMPTLGLNVANFNQSNGKNTFGQSIWTSNWSTETGYPAGSISMLGTNSYEIVGVFSDPALQAAILVFHEQSASFDDYVVIPWTDFPAAFGVPPILSKYASHFTRPHSEPGVIGYAQNGMIGFSPSGGDEKSGELIRFDLSGNALPGSLHLEKLQEVQNAYPIAGGHYYSYNRETRVVTKMNAWWK